MARDYDVVVVGAGPAGATAAFTAARGGLRVLVVERRERVGRPVRCGEYAPVSLSREAPQVDIPAVQAVPRLALHLPSGKVRSFDSPGTILDRGRFDRRLIRAATDAGAELWTRCAVRRVDRRGQLTLAKGSRSGDLHARLIIGADGPRSRVALDAGLAHPKVMMGLQRTVALRRELSEAHLYFWRTCRHGYGWLFPKVDEANLGVALPRGQGREARRALAELSARLHADGAITGASAERAAKGDPGRSGLIPCSGPLPRLAAGRVLLVGDAAGHTDALTGAGIVAAVRAGTLAGEAVVAAGRRGRWRAAGRDYEERWRRTLGRNAARTAARRYELEALWDKDLERAVRRSWLFNADS